MDKIDMNMNNIKKQEKKIEKIIFTEKDLELFSRISGDKNPLHMDEDYARKTAFGQRVVFGILAGISTLKVLDNLDKKIYQCEMEFLSPVFLNKEYSIAKEKYNQNEVTVKLYIGHQIFLRCKLYYYRKEKVNINVKSHANTFNIASEIKDEPLQYKEDCFKRNIVTSGKYKINQKLLNKLVHYIFGKEIKNLNGYINILMLTSYLIGMEIPGENALYLKLKVFFDEKFILEDSIEYGAETVFYDENYSMLDIAFKVKQSEEVSAYGELKSFVRKDIQLKPAAEIMKYLLPDSGYFSDKVALVIGGSRGLGASLVQAISLKGCKVIVGFSRDMPSAELLNNNLLKENINIDLMQGDASDQEWCLKVKEIILEKYGRLDFLVCNAASSPQPVNTFNNLNLNVQDYIHENLSLVITPFYAFVDLLSQFSGVFIGISSIFVEEMPREFPHYVSMKSAMESFIRSVAGNYNNISFFLPRPPRLMTQMNNTPMGIIDAIEPEVVATEIVNIISQNPAPGSVNVIKDFGSKNKENFVVIDQEEKEVEIEALIKDKIIIASTFTADLVEPGMKFWLDKLHLNHIVEFAPYNQVFQELLNPSGLFLNNFTGMNIIFIRFLDWLRYQLSDSFSDKKNVRTELLKKHLVTTYDDFKAALNNYSQKAGCFTLLIICPYSKNEIPEELNKSISQYESKLLEDIKSFNGIDILNAWDFHSVYNIVDIFEPISDKIGHIPFSSSYYDFLTTVVMRRFYSQIFTPYKVIVLDCDNTLWKGVCGELGPDGVQVEGIYYHFQEFLVEQSQKGMILCLCSKNVEEDVWNVFEVQKSMPLSKEHIVDSRINWEPKSKNIESLARVLNLGIDSFIFIDDNPVECAEVRANCPSVLTIQWPVNHDDESFLSHMWVFDNYSVTLEDKIRTQSYRGNVARNTLKEQSSNFDDFLKNLHLNVKINSLEAENLPRVSQLTKRTNQFNSTTIRRSEGDIIKLIQENSHECITVNVEDKFGDYGLVGVMIIQVNTKYLELDSLLLSCRVLGRGVEFKMMSYLAEMAKKHDSEYVKVIYSETPKNESVGKFFETIASHFNIKINKKNGIMSYLISSEKLQKISLDTFYSNIPEKNSKTETRRESIQFYPDEIRDKESILMDIAFNFSQANSISQSVSTFKKIISENNFSDESKKNNIKSCSADIYSEDSESILSRLKQIFSDVLHIEIDEINPRENLENYINDSFKIVEITVELNKIFKDIPSTFLFEHNTLKSINKYLLNRTISNTVIVEKNVAVQNFNHVNEVRTNNIHDMDIAVIGISGLFPGASTIKKFWDNLKEGESSLSSFPEDRWDYRIFYDPKGDVGKTYCNKGGFLDKIEYFDADFFHISPEEAITMDPQQRLFLQTVWHLLEDAGYTPKGLGPDTGVFVGVISNDYNVYGNDASLEGIGNYRNSDFYQIANRISYFFDFQGPSLSLDTACSSSGTALHMACQSILQGECKTAVVGGVNLYLHPGRFIQYSQMKLLSEDNVIKPFGANANGTLLGEGISSLLLKPLKAAVESHDNIYGIIKSTAVNSVGKTNGFTVPNPKAQSLLMKKVLEKRNIDPETVTYIETHGTGTSLGDTIEIRGLDLAYGQKIKKKNYCSIGSVKGNIGHLESAAAISGIIKILLQMKHHVIVPSLNAKDLNPLINFSLTPFFVNQLLKQWEPLSVITDGKKIDIPLRAAISTFGAGGSNAHAVLEEYVNQKHIIEESIEIIIISARTENALMKYCESLRDYLEHASQDDLLEGEKKSEISLSDIAFTLQNGRVAMKERIAIVCSSVKELIGKLNSILKNEKEVDNLYRGTLLSNNIFSDEFTQQHETKNFIQSLFNNNKLNMLAELWANGADIGWTQNRIFNGSKRISLPTYQFEEKKYILPNTYNFKSESKNKNNLIDHY